MLGKNETLKWNGYGEILETIQAYFEKHDISMMNLEVIFREIK